MGDTIEVYSPLIINKLSADEVFLPRQVRVVGILEIGHQQLDSSTVYGTLRLAQDLYGLGSTVHGIDVRLDAGVQRGRRRGEDKRRPARGHPRALLGGQLLRVPVGR